MPFYCIYFVKILLVTVDVTMYNQENGGNGPSLLSTRYDKIMQQWSNIQIN